MNINAAVSQNIKQIRERRKLTLDAAAAATGVSRSMLAQIEKGGANPTISVLWKIANGYKISFSSLLEAAPKRAVIIRAADVQPIAGDDEKYVNYPAFAFDEQRMFETYRIFIDVGGSLEAEGHLAGTEEYITVFAGQVEIKAEGDIFCLEEGDSIRFMADGAHSYKNIGNAGALLSMLLYYPE